MGNKILCSNSISNRKFGREQLLYLRSKFQILCNEDGFLDLDKLALAYMCSRQEADAFIHKMDYSGNGKLDFYQFKCAAADFCLSQMSMISEILFDVYKESDKLNLMKTEGFYKLLKTCILFTQYVYEENGLSASAYKQLCQFSEETLSRQQKVLLTKKTNEILQIFQKKRDKWFGGKQEINKREFEQVLNNDQTIKRWLYNMGFISKGKYICEEDLSKLDLSYQLHNAIELDLKQTKFQIEQVKLGIQHTQNKVVTENANHWTIMAKQMAKKSTAFVHQAPQDFLELEHIIGYRCWDVRNNVKYGPKGQIIYHVAAVGISLWEGRQVMNSQHIQEITCLDVCKGLVATGQKGSLPSVIIWDCEKGEQSFRFRGDIQKGVGHLCFSRDCKLLAVSGQDQNHCIVIYDLQLASQAKNDTSLNPLKIKQNGCRSTILSFKFSQKADSLFVGNLFQILLFKTDTLRAQKLKLDIPFSIALTVVTFKGSFISGHHSGHIAIWKQENCESVIKTHTHPIYCLSQWGQKSGFVTGSSNGDLKLWSQKFQLIKKVKLSESELACLNYMIMSMDIDSYGRILLGLRDGIIVEINQLENLETYKVHVNSHFAPVEALAVHPRKPQFYTAGTDKILCLWDIQSKQMLNRTLMAREASCMDISPDAKYLAVGLKQGIVHIYDPTSMQLIQQFSDFQNPDKQVSSAIKFSPDNRQLAVAFSPPYSVIMIYNIQDYTKVKIECGTSRIFSLDFNVEGTYLMANNLDEEIYVFDVNNKLKPKLSDFRNQVWATYTSPMTWGAKGVWPPCSQGDDILACARTFNNRLLVTGDQFSKIKLFKFPAHQENQPFKAYRGHSQRVGCLRFSYNDEYLISVGSKDCSIMIWKLTQIKGENQGKQTYEQPQEEEEKDEFQMAGRGTGDKSMAIKPFLGQVIASTPNDFVMTTTKYNKLPEQSLEIKYVFGVVNFYLADQVRNQCAYSFTGKVVYPTACLGVVLDPKDLSQIYFNEHREDIVAFAMHPSRKYAATGQMAQKNKMQPMNKIVDVIIWDVETLKLQTRLSGFHLRAIICLSFSPDGEKLLTVGEDPSFTIAMYEWRSSTLLWSCKTSRSKLNAIAWKDKNQFMTCGISEIRLWNKNKGRLCKLPDQWESQVSAVYHKKKFYTGGAKGSIYIWNADIATKGPSGHQGKGKVQCFYSGEQFLYSGGDNGLIVKMKVQGGSLQIVNIIDCLLERFIGTKKGILSLDMSGKTLLVCAKNSSIFQIHEDSLQIKKLMTAHQSGELWGLAVSPDEDYFVTSGDDKILYKWKISQRISVAHNSSFSDQIRALDWNQSKPLIGCVSGNKVSLLDEDLKILYQINIQKSRRQKIEQLKFSPDGKYLAVGIGVSFGILIFSVEDTNLTHERYTEKFISTSRILHIDWSKDSCSMVLNSQAYQLLFLGAEEGKRQNASAHKDTEWETWTCKLGFPVQGIFQGVDFTDVNTVSRSHCKTCLATGNDDQTVKLFKYPVVIQKQTFKEYFGHSSHVTRVRFSRQSNYLVSTGGNDRTIIVWQVNNLSARKNQTLEGIGLGLDLDLIADTVENFLVDYNDHDIDYPLRKDQIKDRIQSLEDQEELFQPFEAGGDKFMAVKPWKGSIKEPTDLFFKDRNIKQPPAVALKLDYCYGYRAKDCRNNVKYISKQRILYHAAALGILHNSKNNRQSFFDLHDDDIISMALNADRTLVATGQIGAKPALHVWCVKDCKSQYFSKSVLKKGISSLAFSLNSEMLACSGIDDDHHVAVVNLKDKKIIVEKGGREPILSICWVSENQFVTVGIKHFKIWTVKGQKLVSQGGSQKKMFVTVVAEKGRIFTGSGDNLLSEWSGSSCVKSVDLSIIVQKQAQNNKIKIKQPKPIESILLTGKYLIAGGKNSKISVLDKRSLELLNQIVLSDAKFNPELFPQSVCLSIRSLDSIQDGTFLIGTLGSQIFQISLWQPNSDIQAKKLKSTSVCKINQGHYTPNQLWLNQVWGLTVHPDKIHALSCSDDATLRFINIKTKLTEAIIPLNYSDKAIGVNYKLFINSQFKDGYFLPPDQATKDFNKSAKGRCVAVSPKEYQVAVGCYDGTIRVFNREFTPVATLKNSKMQISDVKFSPDQTHLVAASHDARIYVFSINKDLQRMVCKSIKKHSSAVLHFDFSEDSSFIHSTCRSYQLLFFEVNLCKQITSGASSLCNQKWKTWTVPLGWPVQGIWATCDDGTNINSVDRSLKTVDGSDLNYMLLATGDDSGKVRIFKYPSLTPNSPNVVGRGHSSHVTKVCWFGQDEGIVSAGGEDQCVMQWRVIKKHEQKTG